MPHPYRKTLPGADCTYQPDDLNDYRDDAWDIRISVGDMPLDEAYYFTIEDPSLTTRTIQDLINDFALNRDRREELDVEDYPELPYLQEELIQYWQAFQSGKQRLTVYANHATEDRPVNLYGRAEQQLSVCTYHDGSLDYRVLDLVFEPAPAPMPAMIASDWRKAYGPMICLLGLAAVDGESSAALNEVVARMAGGDADYDTRMLHRAMVDTNWLTQGEDGNWIITDAGLNAATELALESDKLRERFERFASVSVYPPALDVPEGMDVRLQMIRRSGQSVERASLLLLFDSDRSWISDEGCIGHIIEGRVFERLWEMMSYESHFTSDVLTELAALGL